MSFLNPEVFSTFAVCPLRIAGFPPSGVGTRPLPSDVGKPERRLGNGIARSSVPQGPAGVLPTVRCWKNHVSPAWLGKAALKAELTGVDYNVLREGHEVFVDHKLAIGTDGGLSITQDRVVHT